MARKRRGRNEFAAGNAGCGFRATQRFRLQMRRVSVHSCAGAPKHTTRKFAKTDSRSLNSWAFFSWFPAVLEVSCIFSRFPAVLSMSVPEPARTVN
eukprot:scaffold2192_cov200-Alexandrium_tamarense.AAC.4